MKGLSILACSLLLTTVLSCNFVMNCVEGEGEKISKTLDHTNFNKVALESFDANIEQGNTFSVEISGYENIFAYLDIQQKGDLLVLGTQNLMCVSNAALVANITLPNLEAVTVNGSGNVTVSDFNNSTSLELGINGSGSIQTGAFAGLSKFDSYINGSGDISTTGSASAGSITISGSGTFNGENMKFETISAHVIGSGDCHVDATESLEANITGSGDIYYKGQPRIKTNITGSGDVESIN